MVVPCQDELTPLTVCSPAFFWFHANARPARCRDGKTARKNPSFEIAIKALKKHLLSISLSFHCLPRLNANLGPRIDMCCCPSLMYPVSFLSPHSKFHFVWKRVAFFKGWIALQLFISLLLALDSNLRPYILKIIVNTLSSIKTEADAPKIVFWVFVYLGANLLFFLTNRLNDFSWLKVNAPLKKDLTYALMERTLGHSTNFFQSHLSGSLSNKIRDVTSGVPELLRIINSRFANYFLIIVIASFSFSQVRTSLSFCLIGFVSIFLAGTQLAFLWVRKQGKKAAQIRSYVMGRIVDILANIPTVKLFSKTSRELTKLDPYLNQHVEADQKRDWRLLAMFAFQNLSFLIYQSICLFLLVDGLFKGTVTAGDFVLVLNVNISIMHNLWMLASDIGQSADLLGQISQGLDDTLTAFDIVDAPDATVLDVTHGRIEFKSVSFHYKDSPHFKAHYAVTIKPGEKVGLVGPSGSGKSTFVNLLLRLYDTDQGDIFIDSQSIKKVTQNSLHAAISVIPQDPLLFHRSFIENIRYGRDDASEQDVISAAKQAGAHDFIMQLPETYHTIVGERGVRLSGGQRQRVAIARAILKNAPILVLDEATSQLDSVTETELQHVLWDVMAKRTTLVIAHRLSTLLKMDRILVFKKGHIVEQGTHTELLAQDGTYTQLWNAQVGGFLGLELRH